MSTRRDPVFGCLVWTGRLDREGYGFQGRSRAHIVAWERAHGPIADGREVDHLCRERACVEPVHLELVTRSENERRKAWAWRARRQTCPRGHSMADAVISPNRGRLCRTCQRELLERVRGET